MYKIYETAEYIHLVIEYQEGGTLLKSIVNKMGYCENDARNIMEQILLTLDFMHKKKIIHRDLKPENLLLNTSN